MKDWEQIEGEAGGRNWMNPDAEEAKLEIAKNQAEVYCIV